MYAVTAAIRTRAVRFNAPTNDGTVRELTDVEIDAVAGRGCGVDAAVGALVGFQIGGIAGALIGAVIAGGFCVAGNAV